MKTLADQQLENALQPGIIAEPGTEGGPNFLLSKPEWASIQAYVNNAQILPTTDDEFRNSIRAPNSFDLTDFRALIDAYTLIVQQTRTWRDDTFPSSVNLADRIYQYGNAKVPVYYPAINEVIAKLEADLDDQAAQTSLAALLQSLQQTAQAFADEADVVQLAVKTFADETQANKATLIGPNGDAGLQKYYNDKYGKASAEVQTLLEEISAQRLIATAAMEEYQQDVTIAATTPTYVWWFPIGTIAAAVVAGVYGDKAVKALDRARAANDQIDRLEGELAMNARLMLYINNASVGMTSISTALVSALPVIQALQGAWSAMASDLGRIVEIIDQDIGAALPAIAGLGVDQAMRAWQAVAAAANSFRLTAVIQDQSGIGASMQAHQLRALVLRAA